MNMPPKKSIATIKAKLHIAKTKMESALNSFSKELESEKPNIIAINHYKNTVQLRLEDLEETTCHQEITHLRSYTMATIHRQPPHRPTKSDYLLRLVEADSRSIRATRRQ